MKHSLFFFFLNPSDTTATTNKKPVSKDLDMFLIISLSCLGGVAVLTIIIIGIYKLSHSTTSKKYQDDTYEMDNYNGENLDDPFVDSSHEASSSRRAHRSQQGINWVNDNYGFK